jgi:hypothetical protein
MQHQHILLHGSVHMGTAYQRGGLTMNEDCLQLGFFSSSVVNPAMDVSPLLLAWQWQHKVQTIWHEIH